VSWDREFQRPIAVPGKRKPLVTLRDAALYMTSLPRPERGAEHWRPAVTLLSVIGEKGGCLYLAELAVRFGLRSRPVPFPVKPDSGRETPVRGRGRRKRPGVRA
jgi:hypothetical protein